MRAHDLARWLKIISEPNRLRILDLLMQGEQCNCEMGETLGMAPNLISHHLGVLQKEGLVDARRDPDDARWIHYSINRGALDGLNRAFGAFFDPARIQPRHPACPPTSSFIPIQAVRVTTR
jgi:ArsR family transcriptional regulator, arsenate/arsenite/antimonite-responsive transcriptional repressor